MQLTRLGHENTSGSFVSANQGLVFVLMVLFITSCFLLRALPFRKKTPFQYLFPGASPNAVDLMERCLTFNPARRITVEAALAHPYLQVRNK